MPAYNIHVYPILDPMTNETIELPNDGWQCVIADDKYKAVEALLNDISKSAGKPFIPEIVYVESKQFQNGVRMVEQFRIETIH